jgi:preprotein translocase subunit SecG
MQLVFQILLTLVAIFLILLVLVQRGRGGGLAGALGGMGGSSAFGAKAGDIFTRITIVAAAFWILLCIAAAKFGPSSAGSRLDLGTESRETTSGPALTQPVTTDNAAGESASTDGEAATDSAAGVLAPAGGESAPGETESGASPTETPAE